MRSVAWLEKKVEITKYLLMIEYACHCHCTIQNRSHTFHIALLLIETEEHAIFFTLTVMFF